MTTIALDTGLQDLFDTDAFKKNIQDKASKVVRKISSAVYDAMMVGSESLQFELDEKFDKKVSSANKELKAVNKVLTKLQNTDVGQGRTSLRLHRLTDVRPPLFKLDVFSNHSWQIVFRVRDDGGYEIVHLLTHKEADRYC